MAAAFPSATVEPPGDRKTVRQIVEAAQLGIGSRVRLVGNWGTDWAEFLRSLGMDVQQDGDTEDSPPVWDALLVRQSAAFGDFARFECRQKFVELMLALGPGGRLCVVPEPHLENPSHTMDCWRQVLTRLPGETTHALPSNGIFSFWRRPATLRPEHSLLAFQSHAALMSADLLEMRLSDLDQRRFCCQVAADRSEGLTRAA